MSHIHIKMEILCCAIFLLLPTGAMSQLLADNQLLAYSTEGTRTYGPNSSNSRQNGLSSDSPYLVRGEHYLSFFQASAGYNFQSNQIVFDGGVLGMRIKWFGINFADFGLMRNNFGKWIATYRLTASIYIPIGKQIYLRLYGGPYFHFNKEYSEGDIDLYLEYSGILAGTSLGLKNNIELFCEDRINMSSGIILFKHSVNIGLRLSVGENWSE